IGTMEHQVGQLIQLVDDLRDLSRITQGELEIAHLPVDPASVVDAALEATRPVIEQRHHQITVDLPNLSRRLLGDQAGLTQVLTNLLNNAAKYTPERGHIALSVHADSPRDMLVIRLRDNGQGIAPELLPRIFDTFVEPRESNDGSKRGLGIGLNIVRRLVELH